MAQHAELLARYKHLRRAGLELNKRLAKSVSRSVIDEGGKKLGIIRQNVINLDAEDEIAVLMDFCIHDVRRQGMNAVDRYLAESPPAPEPDEQVLLEALRRARFSLFIVESTEPGVGVHVRDLLRDEPLFLVDIGCSQSASVGLVLATRVMAPEGISMMTGAALPVGVLAPGERNQFLVRLKATIKTDVGNWSPEQASEWAATVIRTCLRQGAATQIAYVEPGHQSRPAHKAGTAPPAQRIGRNDPCPCRSGRKFKLCCGKRGT